MKYLLNDGVALRSWQQARCGYIRKVTNLCERLEVMGAYGAKQHHMALEIWQFAHLDPLRQCYSIRAIACRDGEYTDQRHVCPAGRT